ncbi:cell wall elongation regulator TseB-like domain-containing protein [Sutcliffiella halmapala]|uniref:cell wall elongation regulator TseB-like domain-containing protein n=1 Tax=Sutcliffiella halmapala TaxID=79882 RepID=UPI001115DF2C|nr:DUF5590 domain-containing protein [Sutcliffiella halmapala]
MVIFLIWQIVSIYYTAMKPINDNINDASQIAMTEKNLHTISEVYTYNGTTPYTIVQGTNDEKEELIIWLDEKKEIALTVNAKEGIVKEDVMKYVDTDRTPSEIISISLAMENKVPLWEIKFKDQNDRYNLYYIKFENGDYYQRITF